MAEWIAQWEQGGAGPFGARITAFLHELTLLCAHYGVQIAVSGYDGLQVCDAGSSEAPLHAQGLEDRTDGDRPIPARYVPTWQPIATAPQDGTYLVLALDDGTCVVGYWCASYADWLDGLSDLVLDTPTHWMPLPALLTEDT